MTIMRCCHAGLQFLLCAVVNSLVAAPATVLDLTLTPYRPHIIPCAAVKGCPAGTFKPANSFECAPCEVGTYSLGGYPYPTKCEKCPDGRTTIGKGAYNKDQCGEWDGPSSQLVQG